MALTFAGKVQTDGGVVHPFALGGGVRADPSTESEDCLVWVPEHGLLVAAAGIGNADGHLESYIDASLLAHAIAGAVAGFLTGSSNGTVRIEPDLAADTVRGVWATAAAQMRQCDLLDAVAAAAALLPEQIPRSQAWRFKGTGVELAVLRFLNGTLEVAQVGAFGTYRSRGGRPERIVRCGTLGDDHPDHCQAGSDLFNVITRVVTSDGNIVGGVFTKATDFLPGDRFLLVTRGVHQYVSDQDIGAYLSGELDGIVRTVLAAANQVQGRLDQPSAALVAVS